ncbi:PaaX family transcriptional regulator C-terminal domain-containing protein [Actinoplanes sp. NBRC 103695]|uniref:PaaX family transcriptional regulator n=1 Tax=Actinoplanes sp. NBRC 103695 TaxID=3032202 RepID=UPI0024A3CE73|nr:PaaX family transcriptional regulator C-terminal domain-containing protein [Actinoplanes sp. NBRC 103695]GLY95478.1 phenylacetic acid degradation operon negative regulatory protein [Actinoplanes sp. NBRC 103695]
MRARPALFEVYGDYLRPRGGRAPVSALVKLLAPLGIAAPAVRTAVSRMVRQGWLRPMRLPSGPGYSLTPLAARRLDETSARITRNGRSGWDGRFDLLLPYAPVGRAEASRLTALGYGRLGDHTWIAPRPADEATALLDAAEVRYERFTATHPAGSSGAADIVRRAWDLPGIGRAYAAFVEAQRPIVTAITVRSSDEEAYAARVDLVHQWRGFLTRDPQLPAALLPPRWPGAGAAGFVDRHATRLRPAADRYVERCLGPVTRGGRVGFSES